MEQGFPAQGELARQITSATVAIHLVLLTLVLAAIAGVFLTTRRAARASDVWWWLAAAVAAPVIGFRIPGDDPSVRAAVMPFANGYVGFVWLIAAGGTITTIARVKREGRAGAVACSLVSLVLLGFFMSSLFPAVPMARESARRTQCKNHLKQLGLALHNFHDEHGQLPGFAAGEPPVSWRVALLPYIDAKPVFDEYDTRQEWDSDKNVPVIVRRPYGFDCPSKRTTPKSTTATKETMHEWPTSYVMPAGPGTVSSREQGVRWKDITDGRASTLLVVEACGLGIVWTEPRDFDTVTQPVGINLKGTGKTDSPGLLSSYHLGGAQVVMADGSARFVSEKIDPQLLKRLTTVAGGETIPNEW